jgi:hypothetical protein
VVRDEGRVAGTALTEVRPPAHDTAPRAARSRVRMLLVVVVALACVAAVVAISTHRSDKIEVTSFHGPLPRFTVARTYHVTYRVTASSGPASTQQLFVRRPFESFEEQIRNGKAFITSGIRLGDEILGGGNGEAMLVHTPMSPVKRDVRLDAVAAEAIRTHRLRIVGTASVLGTKCFVVRSAAPLNSGPLGVLKGNSYVDSCVDRRSIVLDERTFTKGRLTTERRATSVRRDTKGADFKMKGRTIPSSQGGGGVRELTIDSRPSSGPFWDIPSAPAGFVHTARYAVVPSQPQAYQNNLNPFGLPGSLVVSIDDVYTRGADAIVIEQGSTVNDAKFTPPSGTDKVDLGSVLGQGQLLLSASASEVDAEPDGGVRFVRVVGTVPPPDLIALARSMTVQPHGTERLK